MAQRSFRDDMRWSNQFLPEIKRIIGEHLITTAPPEEDMQRNTDLIVLTLGAVRVACRVRQHQYIDRYGDEFTIRASRPNDVKTELTKLIEGWGDYLLYGFASQDETRLAAWVLGDLRVFRLSYMRGLASGSPLGMGRKNGDGSSTFQAFRIDEFPREFVVARHVPGDTPTIHQGRLLIESREDAA